MTTEMNWLQALAQMLMGNRGGASSGSTTLPAPSRQPPAAPYPPMLSGAQAPGPPQKINPITNINPITGKRNIQHFVPVPMQAPGPPQPSPGPAMQRRIATKDLKTGKISYGQWEDVPVTPISPEKF